MSRYALIKNNVVINVVKWDGEDVIFPEFIAIPLGDVPCGPGWMYQEGEFIEPPSESVLPV